MPKAKAKRTTKRKDGRGHWPAGKKRNPKMPAKLKARIKKATADARPGPGGGPSVKRIAAETGISDRTLRRWISGEDNPSPDNVARLEAWLAENG